jgi:hypothetical protein
MPAYRSLPPKEFFEKEAKGHLVEGNLFDFQNPVIPIMTRGRCYGSLSQQVVKRGVELPILGLNNAEAKDGFIFVALWDDEGAYDWSRIYYCAAAAFKIGSAGLRLPKVALPILGGKNGMQFLWAAERGIFEASDFLDATGFPVAEHVYVTDKVATGDSPPADS